MNAFYHYFLTIIMNELVNEKNFLKYRDWEENKG